MPKKDLIKSIFTKIAGRYRNNNCIISFGLDSYWRKKLVNCVKKQSPNSILDLATGSGDVAFLLNEKIGCSSTVIGSDFCEAMLIQARKKNSYPSLFKHINFVLADCSNLPFLDNSFEAVTMAFGFRNLENRIQVLFEIYRILSKPNGVLYILEFSEPLVLVKPFYNLYTKIILPLLVRILNTNIKAYGYLTKSIASFPGHKLIIKEIKGTALFSVDILQLTASIVTIYRCSVNE